MSSLHVVLDACVLFPAALRDTLLRVAEARLYRVHWSDEILLEMTRNLVKTRRCTTEQASRLEAMMRRAFPEACVSGYENLTKALKNHPKDRHVLAAAIVCDAQVIVTSNLKDFPRAALEPYHVEAQSPDAFLLQMLGLNPRHMLEILATQAADLGNPPVTLDELLDELAMAVPGFVTQVRRLRDMQERREVRLEAGEDHPPGP